jgi:hypothetical protein
MFTIGAYITPISPVSLATEVPTADVPAVARLRDDAGPPGKIPGGFLFSPLHQLPPRRIASGVGVELGKSAASGITVRPLLNLGSAEDD